MIIPEELQGILVIIPIDVNSMSRTSVVIRHPTALSKKIHIFANTRTLYNLIANDVQFTCEHNSL
jgi:hypothetical protein